MNNNYMDDNGILNLHFQCNLCEESIHISYNCNICNYRLCTSCLNQLVNMKCPQCRNIIPQEVVIITNNNVEIENSRGIYRLNNNYNSTIKILPILITSYLIASYFFGYLLIENHKSILINFLLGFIFLSAIMISFFFLISLLHSMFFYTD